jgi:hypothetical protein
MKVTLHVSRQESLFVRQFANQVCFLADSAWPITVTSAAEPAIGITAVCVAHLRPLGRQLFPKAWFTISEPPSYDIVTFGRLGGREDPSIKEISLDPQLKPGTFTPRPSHWRDP